MNTQSIERYRQAEDALWKYYGAAPTERFLDLAKPKVRVRVQEVGNGPPLLFVHGGPNAGSTWGPLAARLQDFHCILLDRPGCGLSEPIDYASAPLRSLAVDVMASVLDALELPRTSMILSSFGGWWGLCFARAHPDRVVRMVQQGCPAFLPGTRVPLFMRLLAIPSLSRLMSMQTPNAQSTKMIFRQIGHAASLDAGRIPEAFFEWYVALSTHTNTMDNDTRAIQAAMTWRGVRPGLTFGLDELRQMTQPTAFLWGDADPFGGIPLAKQVVKAMPFATLQEAAGGGHLPWLDEPDEAARLAREFLGPGQ